MLGEELDEAWGLYAAEDASNRNVWIREVEITSLRRQRLP
jgi:hypothetical protein